MLFISPYDFIIKDFESHPPREYVIHEDRPSNTFNFDWIIERIGYFKQKKNVNKVLLVLDDVVSNIKSIENKPELINLFFNRQKMIPDVEISIIVSIQKYTTFPAKFRSTLQFFNSSVRL